MSDNRERRSAEGGQEKLKANVKPQYDQTDNGQRTQEKTEKRDRPSRRSRSSDGERRSRRRERDRERGERRRRGRSEETRHRNRDRGDRNRDHVQPPEDSLADTECPVCFCSYDNIFKTPKLLACGHTFCLECLARINVSSAEIKTLSCPVCREVTEIRHGRDLPQLGNNQDVFSKLPLEMRRAQSVRFERSKGKLVLKKPPPKNSMLKKSLTLPVFKKQQREVHPDNSLHPRALEEGLRPITIIDVGRPPSRASGRFQRMFRSNWCYYALVISIVAVTVALLIVGIMTFVVMPSMTDKPPHVTQANDFHSNKTKG